MSLNFALGPRCRVPGKVVAIPGPSKVVDGTLRRNLSIDICQGPVEEETFIEKIFANGRKIYDVSPDLTFVSTSIFAEVLTAGSITDWQGDVIGGHATMQITSTDLAINLRKLRAGYDVDVDGFTLTGYNNPAWQLVSTEVVVGQASWTRALLSIINYSFPYNPSYGSMGGVGGSEAAGNTITVFQDLPNVTSGSFSGLNQYRGTADQSPGAGPGQFFTQGDNPARRGRAWAYLAEFNVSPFGGTVPNIEVVFRQSVTMTVAEAITALVDRSGVDTQFLDVSGVTGDFRGLVAEEPIDSRVLLQIIMQVFGVRYREVGGMMVFYMGSSPDVVDIPAGDLACYASGDDPPPRLIEFVDPPSSDLPSRVEVEFSNVENGLQQGSARETLHALQGNTQKVLRIRTPLSLTEAEALAFGRREMMTRHASRQSRSTAIPPQYLHISEGDVWTTTIDGNQLVSIANSVEYGANRLVRLTGTQLQAQVAGIDPADIATEGEAGDGGGIVLPLSLSLALVDSAPLTDADASSQGLYFACPDYADQEDFIGGQVLHELPGSSEYTPAADVPATVPHGTVWAVGAHASETALPGYWDRASEIIMQPSGAYVPASSTEGAVVGGANRAFYGNELIAWVDTEDLGDGTYKLTTLLRGLRGTEWAISEPGFDFRHFIPIDGLTFVDLPSSAALQLMGFKAVGVHWDEADVPNINHIPRFRSATPFQVYNVRGTRASDGSLTVTWERQTRAVHPIYSAGPSPLLEASQSYEIDVDDSGPVSLGSPYSAGSTRTWVYSAAAQTADGFTPGDPVELSIYQIGSLGRGHSKTVTL
jgi:hypothetical protein